VPGLFFCESRIFVLMPRGADAVQAVQKMFGFAAGRLGTAITTFLTTSTSSLAKKGPGGTKFGEFQKSNNAVLAQSAKREFGTGNRAPLLYFSRLTKRVDSSRNNFVE